jgi:hypothetical protein
MSCDAGSESWVDLPGPAAQITGRDRSTMLRSPLDWEALQGSIAGVVDLPRLRELRASEQAVQCPIRRDPAAGHRPVRHSGGCVRDDCVHARARPRARDAMWRAWLRRPRLDARHPYRRHPDAVGLPFRRHRHDRCGSSSRRCVRRAGSSRPGDPRRHMPGCRRGGSDAGWRTRDPGKGTG